MPLAGSLLDLDEFAARTIAPASMVMGDFFDPTGAWTDATLIAKRTAHRTFVQTQLIIGTSRIYARLRKRYAVPFVAPVPEIACGWLVALVTPMVYRRRGIDPSDEQIESLDAAAAQALDELKEAADSEVGLYDLPLLSTAKGGDDGPTLGGPFGYSEASPYTWTDRQAEAVKDERSR